MIKSVVERGIDEGFGLHLTFNTPEFFKRQDFLSYISKNPVFTWHQDLAEPSEYSDVVVLVEPCLSGDGSESDMPEDIWDTILKALKLKFGDEGENIPAACKEKHIAVRLTNLEF